MQARATHMHAHPSLLAFDYVKERGPRACMQVSADPASWRLRFIEHIRRAKERIPGSLGILGIFSPTSESYSDMHRLKYPHLPTYVCPTRAHETIQCEIRTGDISSTKLAWPSGLIPLAETRDGIARAPGRRLRCSL
jgi:hypothetical protein